MAYLRWNFVDDNYQLVADDLVLISCDALQKKFSIEKMQYQLFEEQKEISCYQIPDKNKIADLEVNNEGGNIRLHIQNSFQFYFDANQINVHTQSNLVFSLQYSEHKFFIKTGIAVFEVDTFLKLVGISFIILWDKIDTQSKPQEKI